MNEYDNLSAVELTIPDDATVAMIAVGSTSAQRSNYMRVNNDHHNQRYYLQLS